MRKYLNVDFAWVVFFVLFNLFIWTAAIGAAVSSEKPDDLLKLFLRREEINDKLNAMQVEANKLQAERVKIQAEIDKKVKEKK